MADALERDWRAIARPEQLPPHGDWTVWLIKAGRGWGKTRTGAEWVRSMVEAGARRIALIGPTTADVRKTMIEGESGLLAISPEWNRPNYEPSNRQLTWPNGAIATTYSAEEPERLRGPQHDAAWCWIGGTKVSTPNGDCSIENIRPGDLVLTRSGPSRVVAVKSHLDQIGEMTIGNAILTGTAEHPIYLNGEWIRADRAKIGDTACVINVSNGTGSSGIDMVMIVALITSVQISRFGLKLAGCIAKCGSILLGLFQPDTRSTTEMATNLTTPSIISSCSQRAGIVSITFARCQFRPRIGRSHQQSGYAVQHVIHKLCGVAEQCTHYVRNVWRELWNCGGATSSLDIASNAENVSKLVPPTSAASVVSTWQPAGEQEVFCLTVEGAHEYFANGILVHNCDELAAWRNAQETWDQMLFGLRLGMDPRICVTTTPKPTKLVRNLLSRVGKDVVLTGGSTFENRENLAPPFLNAIVGRYAGTRLGRQELEAELLEDTPGALWSLAMIEAARIEPRELPLMRRVVVAIDPAVTANEDSDETGIIVAGLGQDGHGYVLEDASGKMTPTEWARRAVSLYHRYRADRVIAEVNQGGALVENTLRVIDENVAFRAVHATKGKILRAEPVSALYEQGRVHHAGTFPELEDQMVTFAGGSADSPDRLDACAYALTDLMVGIADGTGIIEFYRRQAEGQAKDGLAFGYSIGAQEGTRDVALYAPAGLFGIVTGGATGRPYQIDPDGIVTVAAEDVALMQRAGFRKVEGASS
nr:phage terminase large subunit [Beijerinckia mobilis]